MFEGDYAGSEAELREIIAHSSRPVLVAKASALLLSNLGHTRRYEEAFTLANRLTADLPKVDDPLARLMLLTNLSEMFDYAGQIDLAVKYADLIDANPGGIDTLCQSASLRVAALSTGKRLTSRSPALDQAIDRCTATGQPVFVNAMKLVLGSIFLDEDQPQKTLRILDVISPSIRSTGYFPHILSMHLQRAQAYEKLGDNQTAEAEALTVIRMNAPGTISDWLKEAYDVLYRIEKLHGDSLAALAYLEQFAVQDRGYQSDASARSIAYESAKQRLQVQKMENERLSRQNSLLQLQRALDSKAAETSRLYIAVLLFTLGSVAFWLLRMKQSQIRFKRLACRDGLTGIFHHQHFMTESDRALRQIARRQGSACLISVDLDHFKRINDSYGHAVGDAALKHAVKLLSEHIRPGDLFGRLGGEEFGILLIDAPLTQGALVAERIRHSIEVATLAVDDGLLAFSASIGVAWTGTVGYDLKQLCSRSDAALYQAKRCGRNRVVAADEAGSLAVA